MIRLPILSGPPPNLTGCFPYDPQSDVVSAGTADTNCDAALKATFLLPLVALFLSSRREDLSILHCCLLPQSLVPAKIQNFKLGPAFVLPFFSLE